MADMKQEIQARQNEVNELLSAQKMDEALNCYTDDCVIMASAHEIVHGKEGFKKLIESSRAALQNQVGKTEATIEEVFGNGDIVTVRRKGTTYTKDGSILRQTKALAVWKKVDGKWLIHNFLWNTDKPMSLTLN